MRVLDACKGCCALPLLLALLSGPDALAQSPGRQLVPVRTCYAVLTPFGFVPVCSTQPMDPDELERRATEYMTNGAGVLAVPSSGPGADYFHDGAKVFAAPTTSWVPTFPATAAGATAPAPTPPALPATHGAPSPEPAVASSDASPPAAESARPVDETPSTTAAASPDAATSATATGAEPPAAALSTGPIASSFASPAALDVVAPESTVEPTGLALPSGRVVQPWWAAVFAAVAAAAGLLFLIGSRIGGRLRLHRR